MSGPQSEYVWPFLVYGLFDLALSIAALVWLSVAVFARVRTVSPSRSTHPLYFDAAAHAADEEYTATALSRTVTTFDAASVKWSCVACRLLLVATGALACLEAAERVVGGWVRPSSQHPDEYTGVAYALEALHVSLIPLLLLVPLSWVLALTTRSSLCPSNGTEVVLGMLTLVLTGGLMAAGGLAVAKEPSALHSRVQFGITTWQAEEGWRLGGLDLNALSPTVLALYTVGVGGALAYRARWYPTLIAQSLLLLGHFLLLQHPTALFFLPGAWELGFLASLLHTDWMVWRAGAAHPSLLHR